MEISRIDSTIGGWFIGNFDNAAFKTEGFEVAYKKHSAGEKWDHHYHKFVTEINLMISGEMIIQGKKIQPGDIFILRPYEIADPLFITDCEMIVVKTPGIVNDKVVIR